MKILGCDLHAKQQTIAMVDTETGEFTEKMLSHDHVLRGYRLLAQSSRSGLHAHDHAALIVHQIVVVITQPGRRATLGGISGIGIGGRMKVDQWVETTLAGPQEKFSSFPLTLFVRHLVREI
jgi:hypothetical protein